MARAQASTQRQVNHILSEYRHGSQANSNHDPYKIDFLFHCDVVQYKCSCSKYRRLNETYFCRHCSVIRCRDCVAHEVDSQYCQHCLEYIPTIDPKFQMNKCATCYQCPCCHNLLSTSVLSQIPNVIDQQAPPEDVIRRTCKLICEFCRWSSTPFITEGSRVTSNIADTEIPNITRINDLFSFYKSLSQKEKADKKKRRFHARSGNTMDLLRKYGIDNTLSPKLFETLRARSSIQEKYSSQSKYSIEAKAQEEVNVDSLKPAESCDENNIEKLDTEFYYKKDFDIEGLSGIEQRLAQIELQPSKKVDFKPVSKSLSVKRSLRCKDCERNLCRSEYSPAVIRFKIQSAAYYHVPELRLRGDVYPINLKLSEKNIVEFSIQNQTLSPIKLKFHKLPDTDNEGCEVVLPPHELSLGPKDDTADYEHVPLQIRPLNEDTQIIFQSPFKIGFFIKVTPKKQTSLLTINFAMSHDVLLVQSPKESEKVKINHELRIALGPVE